MSERTCEGCVHLEMCYYLRLPHGFGCGPDLPHWRGDCSAVVEAAREWLHAEDNDDPRVEALIDALDALEVDRG